MPPRPTERRIHALVNGKDGGKQRLESAALRRKQPPEFGNIGSPIGGHVDDEIRKAIAVFDATPLDPVGDVQSFQDRGHRTAHPHPGEIVRPGVEAIGECYTVVMQLALKGLAESARLKMLFGDHHLQSGVCEQCRGSEAADAGSDHRHVEIMVALRAAQCRRRPMIGFQRAHLPRQRHPREEARPEDGRHGSRNHNAGGDDAACFQGVRQREQQKQHAPERGEDHVDQHEDRVLVRPRIRGAGELGRPGPSQKDRRNRKQAEPYERQRHRVGNDDVPGEEHAGGQCAEDHERRNLEHLDIARIKPPGADDEGDDKSAADRRRRHPSHDQKHEDRDRQQREFHGEERLHAHPHRPSGWRISRAALPDAALIFLKHGLRQSGAPAVHRRTRADPGPAT